uniref:Uncharacterized protein n=1 Tax=Taiwanofungus camphoratus TaxID=2696576 RepID=A0A4D6SSJ7_TAICA|nr:hypothetical protein [Taiwanofungus camphoratus]QCG70006.1 hypothetical protein [Taiwanofungus camphoratus]
MKLLKLLLSYFSKISTFFEIKFLSILKILLPGRLFNLFKALLPLFKLLYRYGKNIHSIIGLLFLGVVLKFSFNIRTIIDNLNNVFKISFDMFNKILEKLFNVNIKPNNKIIEKTNSKISEKPDNNIPESLRKLYKKDIIEKEQTSNVIKFLDDYKWFILIGGAIITAGLIYYSWDSLPFPKKPKGDADHIKKLAENSVNKDIILTNNNASTSKITLDTPVATTLDVPNSPTSSTGSITPTNNNKTVAVDYNDPWSFERNRDPYIQSEYEKYFAKPEDIKGKK